MLVEDTPSNFRLLAAASLHQRSWYSNTRVCCNSSFRESPARRARAPINLFPRPIIFEIFLVFSTDPNSWYILQPTPFSFLYISSLVLPSSVVAPIIHHFLSWVVFFSGKPAPCTPPPTLPSRSSPFVSCRRQKSIYISGSEYSTHILAGHLACA
jgi:hypothetical protein